MLNRLTLLNHKHTKFYWKPKTAMKNSRSNNTTEESSYFLGVKPFFWLLKLSQSMCK